MRKVKYAILSFILLSNILLGVEKLDKVSVQLHWKYQFEFAGYIAAKEKGFYKDVGLDVELKEYDFGTNVEDEVLQGNANYGVYSSTILLSHLKGRPIRLMASIFKRSAMVIITRPEIKTIKDLVGKTLMGIADVKSLRHMFETQNVDTKNINLVKHTHDIQEFADGKVDAMTASISNQPYKLDQLGIKYNIIDPSDYGMYVLQQEIFTTLNEKNRYPQRTTNFKNATIKGWEYALEHKDELVDIIYDKYSKNISKNSLTNEAKEIEKLILPYTYKIGTIDNNFLIRQLELFKKESNTTSDKTLKDFSVDKNELTQEEEQYLSKNRVIRACVANDKVPIEYFEDGKPRGIAVDLLTSIENTFNLKFKIIETSTWKQSQKYLKNKKCDILPHMFKNRATMKFGSFTKPYHTSRLAFITQKNKPVITSIESAKDKIIALKSGSGLPRKLKKEFPSLTILEGNTPKDMLELVNSEKAYFSLLPLPMYSYLKNRNNFTNLQISGYSTISFDDRMVVVKENEVLLSIMNKSLERLDKNTIKLIYDKWVNIAFKEKTDYTLVWQVIILFLTILVIATLFFIVLQKKHKELRRAHQEIEAFNLTLEDRIKHEVEKNRLLDQQMLQQSRLAQMGEMISMIAHQWRQPLAAISSTAANLHIKAKLTNIDEETVIALTAKISEYSQHLSATIDDFREFFKADKEKRETTCNKLIADTLSIIEVSIKNKNINLIVNSNCTTPLATYDNEVKQVLLNLIKNAEDVLIEKNIENPTITITALDGYITVADNGGGVPEKIMDKIFDPYFSTKTKSGGTGLGLYMSKTIIEKHCGGKLSVSNSDKGAVFKVELA